MRLQKEYELRACLAVFLETAPSIKSKFFFFFFKEYGLWETLENSAGMFLMEHLIYDYLRNTCKKTFWTET